MYTDINLKENELFQKGQSALKKKNFDYAIEIFKNLLLSYPNSLQCRHYLWQSVREKRKAHPASLLNLIIGKINYLILILKLEFYYLSNNRNQAISYSEKIILANSDDTRVLYKLATLFIQQQKTDQAIFMLEEILSINRYNLIALKSLMHLYYDLKNYPKAKILAKLILEIKPHQLDAENILKDISALNTIAKGFDDIKPAT